MNNHHTFVYLYKDMHAYFPARLLSCERFLADTYRLSWIFFLFNYFI